MYFAKEIGGNILSHVDFSKKCDVIKSFLELNLFFEDQILLFLSPQVQDTFNGEINIFLNYNNAWIKLIQAFTFN